MNKSTEKRLMLIGASLAVAGHVYNLYRKPNLKRTLLLGITVLRAAVEIGLDDN